MLNQLRNDPAFVPELDFVMEQDGKLIGQNMFMRATIKADDGRDIAIMAMGPICITPELKRKGFGKMLLDYSLEKAGELGYGGRFCVRSCVFDKFEYINRQRQLVEIVRCLFLCFICDSEVSDKYEKEQNNLLVNYLLSRMSCYIY